MCEEVASKIKPFNKSRPLLGRDYIYFALKKTVKPLMQLKSIYARLFDWEYDFLWNNKRCINYYVSDWSGFMIGMTGTLEVPDKILITFLPMPKSPDKNCIYSATGFIIEKAKKVGVSAASLNFHQPYFF